MTASKETKREYLLTAGNHFELDTKTGEQVERKVGDIVLLTEKQAHALRDKVKDAAAVQLEAKILKAQKAEAARIRAEAEAEDAKEQAKREAALLGKKDGEEDEEEEEEEEEGEEELTEEQKLAKAKAEAEANAGKKPGSPNRR